MQTSTAVSPCGWGPARFDNFAFEGKRSRAISKDTRLSFADFGFMHTARISPKQARRLPDPDFASDLSKLKRLVVAVCEAQRYIANQSNRPFDETRTANERIEAINRSAVARLPAYREALDNVIDRHHIGQHNGTPKAELRKLEIQIQNLDSRILILPRLVAVVTTVLYRFYFLGWDSVQTCNGLPGVKPVAVRQLCRRSRIVWDRLNGVRQMYALPSGELVELVAPSLKQRKELGLTQSKPPGVRHGCWPSERLEKLAGLCQSGRTWREIAKQMGVSHATVLRRAKLHKIDVTGSGWTPERLAELRRLSDAGFSWDEIGKRLGVHGPTARIAAMRHNLRRRTPQGWSK